MDAAHLLDARARVLADLTARNLAGPVAVSALEDAISERGWWVDQWPAGVQYVAGLVAQDVQDALFADVGRWPVCERCPAEVPVHSLFISPDLGGPDPVWVCEESGTEIARLGGL